MPSRRALLVTLATVGLAGCTDARSGGDQSGSSPPGTSRPHQSPEPAGVELVDAAVAYSVRHVLYEDHNGVYTVDGRQFVFVTVDDSGGPAHSLSAFSLVADGEQYAATTFADGEPHDLGSGKRAYRSGSDAFRTGRTGWFCFVVPDRLDAKPTLRLDDDDGTWEWALDGLDRVTVPPPEWAFSVTAPAQVQPYSTFEIEVAATNVGDGPGRFRAAVNYKNIYYQTRSVGLSLDPGESGSATVEAESGDAGQVFSYDVRTAAGETELEVDIEADSASATPTATETE